MKILRIRLTNLNSLKGTHALDLTAEPLAGAGLFAITGSTGAGKTTLLDAVTLALYGKAARYGTEANPEHVMSRHSGECSAEVDFEISSGIYRAVWERHRAGKKPEGKLQAAKRYVYDVDGQALAQNIREAEQKIEELLGLNYGRFLRSVLLAQGDFARFLKAGADERAELLESLTGTAVYSRLGIRAHLESTQRESALIAKEAGLDQIEILEEEAREELESGIREGETQRKKLTGKVEAGAEMLGKIAGLETARKKEQAAAATISKIQIERKAAEDDLESLRLHCLTLPFAERLAHLDAAEASLGSSLANRETAEAAHATARAALARANHLLRAATEAALSARQGEAEDASRAVDKETKAESEAQDWLAAHQSDRELANEVGDLAAAIGELKNTRIALAHGWSGWRDSATTILPDLAGTLPQDPETTKSQDLSLLLGDFLSKAHETRDVLGAASKEAEEQRDLRGDHLDKAKLLAKYDKDRHLLKSAEACPLCGALEHPYAEGAAPDAEIAKLQKELERSSKQLEKARETCRSFTEALKTLSSGKESLLERLGACGTSREELERQLEPLAVAIPDPGAEDELRSRLQKREQAYRKHLKAAEEAGTRRAGAKTTARTATREAETLTKKIDKLPPPPEDHAAEAIDPRDLPPVAHAEETHAEAVTCERTTGTQADDRRKDEKKAEAALGKLRKPLETAVAQSEFQTLDKLRAARLTSETAEKLGALEARLKEQATGADALLKQACADIAILRKEKVLEGEAAESYKTSQSKLSEERDTLLEELATRRKQLAIDDANRKRRKQHESELEQEREALTVWRRLRELIGSHDGSKFRRYAQSISLQILTRHANRHLARLSDRYRICPDQQETLNLQIEDLDQAGARRPMASLSGGESFLASLALALGLSDLAGRSVRIDSLFIDEGFGSLDAETLEVAIAALESLRQNHKTVGVISHVDLLKERIGTQIVVEKGAGGTSQIRIVPETTLSA